MGKEQRSQFIKDRNGALMKSKKEMDNRLVRYTGKSVWESHKGQAGGMNEGLVR